VVSNPVVYILHFELNHAFAFRHRQHEHDAGLANDRRVVKQIGIPQRAGSTRGGEADAKFVGRTRLDGVALCSVVPHATPLVHQTARALWKIGVFELTPKTLRGVGIDYPKPDTIGPDRLAMRCRATPVWRASGGAGISARRSRWMWSIARGNYAGGIIAPGLAAMTDYLHEKNGLPAAHQIHESKRASAKAPGKRCSSARCMVIAGWSGN